MARLMITLTEQEFERLHHSARGELRQPRDQALYILRSVLFSEQSTLDKTLKVSADPTTLLQTGIAPEQI